MSSSKFKPISFFVAIHKAAPLPPPCDNYFALGIGGYQPTTYPFAVSDDEGQSIAHKNKYYSELTGWYWIWKNVDVTVLGLCHYRRYFLLEKTGFFFKRRKKYFRPTPRNFKYLTAPQRLSFIEKALSQYQAIVPQRAALGKSLSQHYADCHVREDWDLFIQGIHELYPQYATETKWFDETQYIHAYNMMIAPKTYFDAYMSTLFPLLFWMENKKPFREDFYQCRVPAFLAERFFSFYLHVTSTRYLEVPVATFDKAAF
jgi:hypothetical protein